MKPETKRLLDDLVRNVQSDRNEGEFRDAAIALALHWESEADQPAPTETSACSKCARAEEIVSELFGQLHNPFISDEKRLERLVALLPLTGKQLDAGKAVLAEALAETPPQGAPRETPDRGAR